MDGINTHLSAQGGTSPQPTTSDNPALLPNPPLLRQELLTVQDLLGADCSLVKPVMEMSEEEWKAVTKSTLGDVYGLCEVSGTVEDFIKKHKDNGKWTILYWAFQNMLKDLVYLAFKGDVKRLLETKCLGHLTLKNLFLASSDTILAAVQTCGIPMEHVCTNYRRWVCEIIKLKSSVAQLQIDLAAKQRDLT